MKKFKKKGFTLIELIAVLVIMAIIALIVTPLVMTIIRKARVSADKRSIDAYGRSIELAIAGYLLDNGSFSTSIEQLTIEYSGNEVVCTTTQINSDSSVYLTGCTVDGRTIDYAYGTDKSAPALGERVYEVGNEVTYNNIDYYVIADSPANESTVTLLKKTPLTTAEINQHGGVGTANNHVNMYVTSDTTSNIYRTAQNINNYGHIAYYTSENCGVINDEFVEIGCSNDYDHSDIKYVVDSWVNANIPSGLVDARLITKDEYETMTIVEEYQATPSSTGNRLTPIYDWLCSDIYGEYWTMSSYDDTNDFVYSVSSDGSVGRMHLFSNGNSFASVRPVIVLSKSVLQ